MIIIYDSIFKQNCTDIPSSNEGGRVVQNNRESIHVGIEGVCLVGHFLCLRSHTYMKDESGLIK